MRFCVECGKEGDKLINGLCVECSSKFFDIILPKSIGINICKECGAAQKKEQWVIEREPTKNAIFENLKFTEEAELKDFYIKEIKGDQYLKQLEVSVVVNYSGLEIERKKMIEMKMRYVLCPSCGKKHGGYYEAKLQLRGEIPDRWMECITEAYAEDVRGGIDLYFPSLSEERESVKKLIALKGAEKKESKKLHTVKDGKSVYKYTTLLRFDEGSDNSRKQKRRKRG
jgi:NMD protein affecting ribosome stability and mRNA decay